MFLYEYNCVKKLTIDPDKRPRMYEHMFDEEDKKISLSAYLMSLMIAMIANCTLPVTILLIIISIVIIITIAIAILTNVVEIGVLSTSTAISVISAIVLSAMMIVAIFVSSLSLFYVYIIAIKSGLVNTFF